MCAGVRMAVLVVLRQASVSARMAGPAPFVRIVARSVSGAPIAHDFVSAIMVLVAIMSQASVHAHLASMATGYVQRKNIFTIFF